MANATSNWIHLTNGTATEAILKHFQEHGEDEFLVKVDCGFGAGIDTQVMKGCHIYGTIKYKLNSTIHAFARIYRDEELIKAEKMRAFV